MRIALFGDEESTILFNLVGLDEIIFEKDDEDFEAKFNNVINDPEIGIVIITERIFVTHKEFILQIKMQRRSPIIIEIPGMVDRFEKDYAQEIIREYIGIKLTD